MSEFMELAEEYAKLTREKRDMEASVKPISDRLREIEAAMLAAHEASGIGSSVKLASGGTIIVSEKTSVKKTDEAALIAWLDAHGLADIAKRSVNTNTLGALVRERLEKFEPAPDGCEPVHFKTVTFRA